MKRLALLAVVALVGWISGGQSLVPVAEAKGKDGSLPVSEITEATDLYNADIIALSVSSYCANKVTSQYILELRSNLKDEVDIWIGGSGARAMSVSNQNVHIFTDIMVPVGLIKKMRLSRSETTQQKKPTIRNES